MKIKCLWLCLAVSSLPALAHADIQIADPTEGLNAAAAADAPRIQGKPASAEDFDLSRYELTPADVRSMEYLIGTGEYSLEWLDRFAKSYEKAIREGRPWVPPHTFDELDAVVKWAEGAAFSVYAARAGYSFNAEAYRQDCPYRILFNYGYATGRSRLGRDVISSAIQTMTTLNIEFQRGDTDFAEYFYALALKRGFGKYLARLEERKQTAASARRDGVEVWDDCRIGREIIAVFGSRRAGDWEMAPHMVLREYPTGSIPKVLRQTHCWGDR